MTGKAVLALNAGSSSIKFALFRIADGGATDIIAQGEIEGMWAITAWWRLGTGSCMAGRILRPRYGWMPRCWRRWMP